MTSDVRSDDYSATRPGSLLGRLALSAASRQRRKLFDLFVAVADATPADQVLDVGVTSDERYASNNYLESWYPYTSRITAAGLASSSYLSERFPGLDYRQIDAGARLPFADRSFDLVHASAVIEHVGSRDAQAFFLSELWRVCRRTLFITTPNRWFPIEVHTSIPFIHWLPPRRFRAILAALNLAAWADESQLNLMSRKDLRKAAADGGLGDVDVRGVRLAAWVSNLALVARRDREH